MPSAMSDALSGCGSCAAEAKNVAAVIAIATAAPEKKTRQIDFLRMLVINAEYTASVAFAGVLRHARFHLKRRAPDNAKNDGRPAVVVRGCFADDRADRWHFVI